MDAPPPSTPSSRPAVAPTPATAPRARRAIGLGRRGAVRVGELLEVEPDVGEVASPGAAPREPFEVQDIEIDVLFDLGELADGAPAADRGRPGLERVRPKVPGDHVAAQGRAQVQAAGEERGEEALDDLVLRDRRPRGRQARHDLVMGRGPRRLEHEAGLDGVLQILRGHPGSGPPAAARPVGVQQGLHGSGIGRLHPHNCMNAVPGTATRRRACWPWH